MAKQFIYPFTFGDKSKSDLLGGKGANLAEMVQMGLPVPLNPFESLDQDGVGLLVKIARDQARAYRKDFKLGVCGEHGGDPRSIHFFHDLNLDYVSCSPFRVPVARLESGRAKLIKS